MFRFIMTFSRCLPAVTLPVIKRSFLFFVLVLLFNVDFKVFDYPVDEKDYYDSYGGIAPHAVAAQASHGSTAPDGGSAVEAVYGEPVPHDDAGTEEAHACYHLR